MWRWWGQGSRIQRSHGRGQPEPLSQETTDDEEGARAEEDAPSVNTDVASFSCPVESGDGEARYRREGSGREVVA